MANWPDVFSEAHPGKSRGGAKGYDKGTARAASNMPCGKSIKVTLRERDALGVLKDRAVTQVKTAAAAHIRKCAVCKERLK